MNGDPAMLEVFARMMARDPRELAMVFESGWRVLWASEGVRQLYPMVLESDFDAGMILPEHLLEQLERLAPDVLEEISFPIGKLQTWHGCAMAASGRYYLMGRLVVSVDEDVFQKLTLSMNEVLNLYRDLARQKAELELANKRVKALRGLLPICASCKKIRDDQGYWAQVEEYITRHADVEFSHGLCPDCLKRLYPDLF